jgi:AraC-like DNA-binding protein
MSPDVPGEPVSWFLDGDDRQVTFASCRGICVYTDTASTGLSSAHAQPAWTLLVPVASGNVRVVADGSARVDSEAILLPPLTCHRVETEGPHVSVYLSASMAARSDTAQPRRVSAPVAHRMLDALAVDSGVDPSSAIADLDPSFKQLGTRDPRVTSVFDALSSAVRLDVLAAEIGMSPSRMRAVVHDAVGVPMAQLRLWSRLGHALALLPKATAADAAATAGFADQAHFTRTARRFLGRTPMELSPRSLASRAPDPRWRASVAASRKSRFVQEIALTPEA